MRAGKALVTAKGGAERVDGEKAAASAEKARAGAGRKNRPSQGMGPPPNLPAAITSRKGRTVLAAAGAAAGEAGEPRRKKGQKGKFMLKFHDIHLF